MRSVQNEVSSTTTNETPRMSPQPSIVEALEKESPIQSSSRRANDITDAIAYFLAKDSVPFNAVERPGFKRLLHVLEPRYHVPSKSTFSRDRIIRISQHENIDTTGIFFRYRYSIFFQYRNSLEYNI